MQLNALALDGIARSKEGGHPVAFEDSDKLDCWLAKAEMATEPLVRAEGQEGSPELWLTLVFRPLFSLVLYYLLFGGFRLDSLWECNVTRPHQRVEMLRISLPPPA